MNSLPNSLSYPPGTVLPWPPEGFPAVLTKEEIDLVCVPKMQPVVTLQEVMGKMLEIEEKVDRILGCLYPLGGSTTPL